jgi:ribonuclease P protein component
VTGAQRLRRSQRLAAADVGLALKSGRRFRGPRFSIYGRPNAVGLARIALVVPKKLVPRAVDRNRIRRIARETFRRHQEHLVGLDLVVRLVQPCGNDPVTAAEVLPLLDRCADAFADR